jgi:type II secretory pathway pseudopilin PulG
MVVIIVVVALIVGLIKRWMELRAREIEQRNQSVHDDQKEQIRNLMERVRILETIVTDRNYELKEKFAELAD